MTTEDLAANCAGAFSNRIGFGKKPALVLIDFARAYYDPDCNLYAGESAVTALESALRLREAAHQAGILVVLTHVTYQPGLGGIDGGRFYEKALPVQAFIQGRSTAGFAEGLEPRPDELLLPKQYASAFFATSLAPTLTAAGIDTVILTGLTTSGCVRAGCVDAMQYGFRAIVVSDACGDRHPGPHEANLFDMNAKYGDVVTEAEARDYLAGIAAGR